jgi:hypothetical protein
MHAYYISLLLMDGALPYCIYVLHVQLPYQGRPTLPEAVASLKCYLIRLEATIQTLQIGSPAQAHALQLYRDVHENMLVAAIKGSMVSVRRLSI